MKNNQIDINFLHPNRDVKKNTLLKKSLKIFTVLALILNMGMTNVFLLNIPFAQACHGDITIIKEVVNSNSSESFGFTGGLGKFNLADGENKSIHIEGDIDYVITEDEAEGWELEQINCVGGTTDINLEERSVTISLENLDNVACTFTNKEIPTPVCGDGTLDITEECDDGNGENGDGCSSDCKITRLDCPLTASDDEILVNFTSDFLRSDDSPYEEVVDMAIPAGSYTIKLVSFDGYKERVETSAQPHEQYNLIFKHGFNIIAESGMTDDLEDNVLFASNIKTVNNPLTIGTTSTQLIAKHSFYPDDSSPNSVIPICALFIPAPFCGDNILDTDEECDDGNIIDGDLCSATCTIETPAPVCGDGNLDTGEECDDGNIIDGDLCSATCTIETPAPVCGDGNLDTGEKCDDGNIIDGDLCSATCTNETPEPTPFCGDGIVNNNEECDDGNTNEVDKCNSSCEKIKHGGGGNVYFLYDQENVTPIEPPVIIEEPIVLGEEGAPILEVKKTISNNYARAGEKGIEYKVTITNTGNLTAVDVALYDVLPENWNFTNEHSNTRSWMIGNIEPGESTETIYLVDVPSDANPASYVNVAKVKAANFKMIKDSVNVEIVQTLPVTGFDNYELSILLSLLIALFSTSIILKKNINNNYNQKSLI